MVYCRNSGVRCHLEIHKGRQVADRKEDCGGQQTREKEEKGGSYSGRWEKRNTDHHHRKAELHADQK